MTVEKATISEAKLKTLTSLLANKLSACGLSVSDANRMALNDVISQFLENEMNATVLTGDNEYAPIDIYFGAGDTIMHQRVRMYDTSLTQEQIIRDLKIGKLMTDIDTSETHGHYVRDEHGHFVGDVVSQGIWASTGGFRKNGYVFSNAAD
jgi:hypothetical protein